MRRTILHTRRAVLMRDELERVGAFGAEMAARDRRLRIAFDADDFAVAVIDELATADAAIRTDRSRHARPVVLRPEIVCAFAHRLNAGAVRMLLQLTDERPLQQELGEHEASVCKNSAEG